MCSSAARSAISRWKNLTRNPLPATAVVDETSSPPDSPKYITLHSSPSVISCIRNIKLSTCSHYTIYIFPNYLQIHLWPSRSIIGAKDAFPT